MASFMDPLPCGPYTTPEALLSCCKVAVDAGLDVGDIRLIDAIADASLLMYYWTARTYGLCNATLRVSCNAECSRIDLGLWPITALTAVRYEGVDQDVTKFHIDEFHYLVRSDSTDPWPYNPNTWAETGGAHDSATDGYVFEVEVTYGIAAPSLLERATRALACELLATTCGLEGECKLPERVSSVSRRGISMEVASSTDLLRDGLTGIYAVDLAIKALNPSRLQSPTFVWSPDLQRNRIQRVYT